MDDINPNDVVFDLIVDIEELEQRICKFYTTLQLPMPIFPRATLETCSLNMCNQNWDIEIDIRTAIKH